MPARMTVEEFSALPETNGPVYYELRTGVIRPVARPKAGHTMLQHRLSRLLEGVAGAQGVAFVMFTFRSQEYDVRVADVAYVSRRQIDETDPDDYFRGAPELVIEVLARSDTAAELHEKERLCLENGCGEFWVVYPDTRSVKVSTPDGHTITYRAGQHIPPALFGDARLAVDAIWQY